MGLDNGIILRLRKKDKDLYFPPYTNITTFNDESSEFEVCYWRKCQGIRAGILEILGGENPEVCEYDLTPKTITKIRDMLYEVLCNPDDWWSSIWEFDEMISHTAREIVNLTWLLQIMEDEPHATAYFYDSY